MREGARGGGQTAATLVIAYSPQVCQCERGGQGGGGEGGRGQTAATLVIAYSPQVCHCEGGGQGGTGGIVSRGVG